MSSSGSRSKLTSWASGPLARTPSTYTVTPCGSPITGDTWNPRSDTSSWAVAPSSSEVVTPGSCSRASASERTPRASRAWTSSVAVRPARPRASSRTVGSRTPVTTTGARAAVSLRVESGCWAPAGAGSNASSSAAASHCGLRIADCGFEGRVSNPQSAITNPQSIERIQPGDFLAEDERMHIVRPLVRVHRLEVGEVAHRLILRQDAVGAEQAARLARHVGGDVHVVALGEGHLLRRDLPLVLEPPQLQAQELRLGDLGEHLREPRLLQLETADRLPEHQAVLGVAHRFVVTRHRGADRPPRDPVARLGEAHERGFEAAGLGQQRVLRDARVLEHELARVPRAQGQLPLLVLGRAALRVGGHDEATDRVHVVARTGLGPHDRRLRRGAVGDPHLGAVQHPAVLRLLRDGDHAAGVRAVVGLGEPEAADHFARRHRGQPAPLLLIRSEGEDRIHDEGALHRREGADTRIAALELLHDQPVRHVVEPGAAVLLRQIGAEQPELGHLGDQLPGKATVHVMLADDRHESLVDPGAYGVADGALLFGEQAVDVVEVDALEFSHMRLSDQSWLATGTCCAGAWGPGRANAAVSDARNFPPSE